MVDLLGAGYVVDFCVSRFREKQEKRLYQTYVTDALMYLNNNFAKAFGGTAMTTRFRDILEPPKVEKAEVIISDVMKNAGLTFGD